MHEVINRRSPEMWKQIAKAFNFQKKKVLDLGSGYCDLAIFANKAGARVMGIEKDPLIAERAERHVKDSDAYVVINVRDIEDYVRKPRSRWDVIFCTSVLPYLEFPDRVMEWMAQHAPTSIIEHQYAGDGPGPTWIQDDDDMQSWLKHFWPRVIKIGQTEVIERGAIRSIWMCKV
jgi:protein-L-isoaspartate O-methyltransferase